MTFSSLVVVITIAILYIGGSSLTVGSSLTSRGSFSVDLLHRDSVDSPFYDHSMTFSQRLGHTLRRSFKNAKRFKSNVKGLTYQVDAIPDHGEFLLNISYGNPPLNLLAIADTGSDLTWMQCKPCTKCFQHDGPIFDPKSSSTYQPIPCKSKKCKSISAETSCSPAKNCHFFSSYGDGSISNGTVATETIKLGDRVLPNILFGCSFTNDGTFTPSSAGIVGLGGGDASLVSQISSLVAPKFSYCLIPYPITNELTNKSSKLIFGDFDFGPDVVSTPLVLILPKTYYFVTLEGISVGNKRLSFSDDSDFSKPSSKGNMIVDSGTTLTFLPKKLYDDFEAAMKDAINIRTMKDPQKALSLCYRGANVDKIPKVTVHFDGADVELNRENLFVTVSKHIICLGFTPTSDQPVFGNLAQINHLVGYDLYYNTLSFKRTDCEKM